MALDLPPLAAVLELPPLATFVADAPPVAAPPVASPDVLPPVGLLLTLPPAPEALSVDPEQARTKNVNAVLPIVVCALFITRSYWCSLEFGKRATDRRRQEREVKCDL